MRERERESEGEEEVERGSKEESAAAARRAIASLFDRKASSFFSRPSAFAPLLRSLRPISIGGRDAAAHCCRLAVKEEEESAPKRARERERGREREAEEAKKNAGGGSSNSGGGSSSPFFSSSRANFHRQATLSIAIRDERQHRFRRPERTNNTNEGLRIAKEGKKAQRRLIEEKKADRRALPFAFRSRSLYLSPSALQNSPINNENDVPGVCLPARALAPV